MADAIKGARRVEPSIPASDPRFKWTTGADVQATWRRFGWTPPSEKRTKFYDDLPREPAHIVRFPRSAA